MGPEDRYTISHKIPAAHQTFRMRAVCPAAGLSAQVKPAFTFRSPLTQKRSGTQKWFPPRFCHFFRSHYTRWKERCRPQNPADHFLLSGILHVYSRDFDVYIQNGEARHIFNGSFYPLLHLFADLRNVIAVF